MTGLIALVAFVVYMSVAKPAHVDGSVERILVEVPFLWYLVTAVLILRGPLAHRLNAEVS